MERQSESRGKEISTRTLGVFGLLRSLSKQIRIISAELCQDIPDTCYVINKVKGKTFREYIRNQLTRSAVSGQWNLHVNVLPGGTVSVNPDNNASLSIKCMSVRSDCPECPLRP